MNHRNDNSENDIDIDIDIDNDNDNDNDNISTNENRNRLILKMDDTISCSSSITGETSTTTTTTTPTSSCTPSPIQHLLILSVIDSNNKNNNNNSNPDDVIVTSAATIENETRLIEDSSLYTTMNDSTHTTAVNNNNNNNVLLDDTFIKPSTIHVTSSTIDDNDEMKKNSQSINGSDSICYTMDTKSGATTPMNSSNALVTISNSSSNSSTTDIALVEFDQKKSTENNGTASIDNIITTSSSTTVSNINTSTSTSFSTDNTLPIVRSTTTTTTNTLNQSRSSTRSQQQQEQEEMNRSRQQQQLQQLQRQRRRNRIRIDDSIIEQQYQQREYNREYIKQLQTHVTKEAEKMLDKLIEHLQKKPTNKYKGNTTSTTTTSTTNTISNDTTTTTTPIVGVTLPASAIGWISSYVFPDGNNENIWTTTTTTTPTTTITKPASIVEDTTTPSPTTRSRTQQQQQQIKNSRLRTLSRSMRSRLRLLMILLPRLTHLRVVRKLDDNDEEWPQPMKGKDGIDVECITDIESSMNNENSIDTNTDDELLSLYSYFIEYRKWKFTPSIDLRLFTNSLNVLLLDQIPGRLIHYWNSIQSSLQVLRVERTCIYNHYQPKRKLNNNRKTPGIANTSETNVPMGEQRKRGRPLFTPTSWTLFHCYFLESDNIIDYDGVQKQHLDHKSRLDQQQQQQSEDTTSNNSSMYNDPLAPQMPESIDCSTDYTATRLTVEFSALTHVRFSNCCLGEATGNVRRALIEITSPKLQSICLSQNQIVTERTALQGISTLSFLSTIDLSFNSIYSLQNVHYRIGNLQRLILSNNFISTTNGGIDRLVALEELALDYNCISDLASISGLAQLPELKRLHLKGNPLQKNIWRSRRRSRLRIHRTQKDTEGSSQQKRSRLKALLTFRSSNGTNKKTESKFLSSSYAIRAYRVDVLNLFRECRQYDLPSNATYRMLQKALPILDGELTTLEELIALRQRTFVPIMAGTINPISIEHSMLVPSIRNIMSNDNEEQVQASDVVKNNEGIISFSHNYRKNGKRKYRRKQVHIIDMNDASEAPVTVGIVPYSGFDDSTAPGVCSFGFTVSDVILSLENSLESISIQRRDDTISLEAESVVEPTDTDTVAFPDLDPYDNLAIRYLEAAEKAEIVLSNTPTKTRPRKKTVSIALKKHDSALMIMLDPAKDRQEQSAHNNEAGIFVDEEECLSQDLTTEMKNRHSDTISLDNELRDLSLSAIKVDGNDDVEPKTGEEVASQNFIRSVASMSTHSEDLDTVPPPVSQIAYLNNSTDDTISVATMNSRVALRFPDQAWHGDDQSVISNFSGMASDVGGTAATNTINLNATKMFLWAEDNAVYEGPRTYKGLKIVDNLELYFRLFVFSKSVSKAAALLSDSTQDDLVRNFQTYQEQYPRIQLWPVDRRKREFSTASNRDDSNNEFIPAFKRIDESAGEDFRRVWKERVIACGKPSLQRLLPSRVPRYSFHGELIWSTADTTSLKPEVAVEHRNVIFCLSNRAIYIIMDNDRLTKNPIATKTKISDVKKKRFPLPISEDALFEQAKWPHAVARYPFEALKGITIGFAFQRLTLHFSPSNNVSSKRNKNTIPQIDQGDFTYVLLISNKVNAVQILNEIQQLANDVREAYEGGPSKHLESSSSMNIDNDDRHVLDTLGVAVAPDTISVILHYQILRQKWRRGDRGLVRRVCIVTDTKMYLLDEDYFRDGSDVASLAGVGAIRSQQQPGSAAVASSVAFKPKTVAGETTYRLVDAASLDQISQVQAADADPNAITFVVKPLKHFQKSRHWRLVCRDRYGAERLVEDVRKAIAMS